MSQFFINYPGRRIIQMKKTIFKQECRRILPCLLFIAFNTKLPEMTMLVSKDFVVAKKVTSSWAQADDH